MDETAYKKAFGIHTDNKNPQITRNALHHALDIRKFEIELYWKRATYFWTLIASTFAAHFVILNAEHIDNKNFIAYLVACIGFVFTFAWLQVNRGSKQWQENWENHVELLEDSIVGPLYKTTLSRPLNADGWFETHITGPSKISVSKTNQIVNLFTLFIWIFLAWSTLSKFSCLAPISWEHIIITSATFFTCFLIVKTGQTYTGNHNPVAMERKTAIK